MVEELGLELESIDVSESDALESVERLSGSPGVTKCEFRRVGSERCGCKPAFRRFLLLICWRRCTLFRQAKWNRRNVATMALAWRARLILVVNK